ncbi:hypothetical protein LR48_Vigan07g126900 [Vigna angularis]|uniref:Uncharacterized protein n=1 Tax=Phaseolus angularis TaxID=3914 RepID=A0A0L9UXJ2_PHAAN|nr:hypothetical protein LR48_Vigan07g126900 [Vigna angularis]
MQDNQSHGFLNPRCTTKDRFDVSSFSVPFGGQIRDFSSKGYIDVKNDRLLDDCWRYCIVASKRTLDDANPGQQVLDTQQVFKSFKSSNSPLYGEPNIATIHPILQPYKQAYHKLILLSYACSVTSS